MPATDGRSNKIEVKQVSEPYEMPEYLVKERGRLLWAAVSQGYNRDDIEKLLADGIASSELPCLIDILNNNQYRTLGNVFQVFWKKHEEETRARESTCL